MVAARAICALIRTKSPRRLQALRVENHSTGIYCFGETALTMNELCLRGYFITDFYCLENNCTLMFNQ